MPHDMKLSRGASSPAFIVTAILLVVGIGVLHSNSRDFGATLVMTPFALWPLVVSLLLTLFARTKAAQITLVVGSTLYGGFFIFLYIQLYHVSPSPQSGIALLFIGFYSLPVMLVVWVVSLSLMVSGKKGAADSKEVELET